MGNDNLLAQSAISYSTALLMGITAGISYCSVACAPFISTYIMGSEEGALQGFKSFIVFTIGRTLMCGALGLASGCLGTTFFSVGRDFRHASIIFGTVMVSIGLLMFIHPVTKSCKRSKTRTKMVSFFLSHSTFSSKTHLFIMGMTFATIPCLPMVAMLTYSLQMTSIISSGILMSLFGIGSAISPLVVVFVLAGWLSKKIKTSAPHYRMLFQKISGLILILLGAFSTIASQS